MIFLVIFFSAVVVYYSMYQYKCYNYRKHELKLIGLIDELHQYAHENKIDSDNWAYKFLDSSLTKSLQYFGNLNIFFAMYLRKTHKNDPLIEEFKRLLEENLSHYPFEKKIYIRFQSILSGFVIRRHIVILFLTLIGIKFTNFSIKGLRKIKDSVRKSLNELVVLPEITTSKDFIAAKNKSKSLHVVPLHAIK